MFFNEFSAGLATEIKEFWKTTQTHKWVWVEKKWFLIDFHRSHFFFFSTFFITSHIYGKGLFQYTSGNWKKMEIFENSQSCFENLSPLLLKENISQSQTDDDFQNQLLIFSVKPLNRISKSRKNSIFFFKVEFFDSYKSLRAENSCNIRI